MRIKIEEFNKIDSIVMTSLSDVSLWLARMKDGSFKIFDKETHKQFRDYIFNEN